MELNHRRGEALHRGSNLDDGNLEYLVRVRECRDDLCGHDPSNAHVPCLLAGARGRDKYHLFQRIQRIRLLD